MGQPGGAAGDVGGSDAVSVGDAVVVSVGDAVAVAEGGALAVGVDNAVGGADVAGAAGDVGDCTARGEVAAADGLVEEPPGDPIPGHADGTGWRVTRRDGSSGEQAKTASATA